MGRQVHRFMGPGFGTPGLKEIDNKKITEHLQCTTHDVGQDTKWHWQLLLFTRPLILWSWVFSDLIPVFLPWITDLAMVRLCFLSGGEPLSALFPSERSDAQNTHTNIHWFHKYLLYLLCSSLCALSKEHRVPALLGLPYKRRDNQQVNIKRNWTNVSPLYPILF